ncbi:MAG: alanine racemase [Bdellovibrionales bacterium]|nr:alanine racemase [Bdellovibrionales bacterium]
MITKLSHARLDFHALEKNWKAIEKRVGKNTTIAPCVKSNAYGHGMLETVEILTKLGAKVLCVADLYEAERVLSHVSSSTQVFCMGGIDAQRVSLLAPYIEFGQLHLSVHSMEDLDQIEKAKVSQVHLHMQIETGMNRLGFSLDDVPAVLDRIEKIEKISLVGAFTHFADSDQDMAFTLEQSLLFDQAQSIFKSRAYESLILHSANSGAILSSVGTQLDWVRPGIMLYGYPPSTDLEIKKEFEPVMTWSAPIVTIKKVKKGQSVGYAREYKATKDLTLATLAVGYGDGFDLSYAAAWVGYKEQRCKILGRVCMDLIMIDVSEIPDPRQGDFVHLMGDGAHSEPTALDLSWIKQSIPYEVLCRIGSRVQRTVHFSHKG